MSAASRGKSWFVPALVLSVAFTPLQSADGQRSNEVDAVGFCAAQLQFEFTSQLTQASYSGTADRGSNGVILRVNYSFADVHSGDDRYEATGGFYVYPYECLYATWVTNGQWNIPYSRFNFIEVELDGDSGYCDYQLIHDGDPECDSAGGSGDGYSDGEWYWDGPGVDGTDSPDGTSEAEVVDDICTEYSLTPGTYDVYVDGQYDSTVTC
jgi:hypothetical protein